MIKQNVYLGYPWFKRNIKLFNKLVVEKLLLFIEKYDIDISVKNMPYLKSEKENYFMLGSYIFNLVYEPKTNILKIIFYNDFDIDNIKVNFGVELELCFFINKTTLENFDDSSIWSSKIIIIVREIILKKVSEKFKKRFPIIMIENFSKPFFFIDSNKNEILTEAPSMSHYDHLIFTYDSSIECDKKYDNNFSINCEIVSPVLKNMGDFQIMSEILDMGITYTNKSAGFHFNFSFMNDDEKVEINTFLFYILMCDWLKYDAENYEKLRGSLVFQNFYAKSLSKIFNSEYAIEWISHTYFNFPDGIRDYYRFRADAYSAMIMANKSKYLSLTNHKNIDVIEARLFPSSVDLNVLEGYINDTLDIIDKFIEKLHNPSYVSKMNDNLVFISKYYSNNPNQIKKPLDELYFKYFEYFNIVSSNYTDSKKNVNLTLSPSSISNDNYLFNVGVNDNDMLIKIALENTENTFIDMKTKLKKFEPGTRKISEIIKKTELSKIYIYEYLLPYINNLKNNYIYLVPIRFSYSNLADKKSYTEEGNIFRFFDKYYFV